MNNSFSVIDNNQSKEKIERTANIIFAICAFFAVFAVFSISVYMIISGIPALYEVGIKEILFGTLWQPNAEVPSYGILYVILTSVVGTLMAVLISVPIGVGTAIFLAYTAPKPLVSIVKPAIELLAAIPSVIYGLIGIIILNPLMYKIELILFADTPDHQYTGGSNLLSAVIVLAVMILPTVINISESALKSVPEKFADASLALGATRIQTIFKVILPSAKSGIVTAIVLGVGRAVGEAMAITMVAGNNANLPLPFNSVRFLTTAVVAEMSYATDTHKRVLYTIGLILFAFIMIINLILNKVMKKGLKSGTKNSL